MVAGRQDFATVGSDDPASRVTVSADRAILDEMQRFLPTELNDPMRMTIMASAESAHDAGMKITLILEEIPG